MNQGLDLNEHVAIIRFDCYEIGVALIRQFGNRHMADFNRLTLSGAEINLLDYLALL